MIFASRARMPLLPLPCLIATGRGSPSTICISRPALPMRIGTFLDRGAVGRGAGMRDRLGLVVAVCVSRGLWRRGDDAGGQPVERFGQQGLKGRAVLARAGRCRSGQGRRCRAACACSPSTISGCSAK